MSGTAAPTTDALAAFVRTQEPDAVAVHVDPPTPIESVGNAREPWELRVRIERRDGTVEHVHGVMLVKARAGQLETELTTEFAALRAVHGTGVPAPAPRWLDASGAALGRPFFVTEHVVGRADMSLLRAAADDEVARSTLRSFADAAAALHAVDVARADPTQLPRPEPACVAGAQLDVWEPLAERQLLEPLPALRFAFSVLRASAPVAARVSLVHGDLRVGNFLAHEGRVTALLDWEMAHVGDAHEDLAWAYRAIWSPARALPFEEFLARYEQSSGVAVDREVLRWYQMFNEVKHVVISLTAARSFHDGRSTNLRFADRNTTVAPFLARFYELAEGAA